MILCVCMGIGESIALLVAGIFASIPFVSKLFRRRLRTPSKPGNRPCAPYVTGADLVKLEKRNKK